MILFFSFLVLVATLAWILVIWDVIKFISSLLYKGFISIYRYLNVTRPMIQSGLIEQKQIEQRIQEEEVNIKQQQKVLYQQNLIINASLSKVRDLRIRFPYANEDLFKLYLKKYPVYSIPELLEIENEIKKNHLENETNYQIENDKNYTLEDLDNIGYLEEIKENPLVMRIYKINNDYVIHIKNVDSNYDVLYKSKDYLILYKIMLKVRKEMDIIKKYKQNITTRDIDNIIMTTFSSIKFNSIE